MINGRLKLLTMSACVSITLVCLPKSALAVTFYGVVDAGVSDQYGSYGDDAGLVFEGTYQPRSGNDLIGASAQAEFSTLGSFATASAAVYGTDSSRTPTGLLDPALLISGTGVEPMLDLYVAASSSDKSDSGAGSNVQISVQHRVALNPNVTIPNNILNNVLAQINNVPVTLHWAYSMSGEGVSSAEISATVSSSTGDCSGGVSASCGGFLFSSSTSLGNNSGSIPFIAKATTDAREALYDITLGGQAGARASGIGGYSEMQAVLDPFLEVDQSWSYAQYFVVQQESTINEGEWVGITRNYLAPVPIPPAVWLFGSGLIGLIGVARRKKA